MAHKPLKSKSAHKEHSRVKIMIVDDDEGILKAVSLLLSVEGFEVEARNDAGFVDELLDTKEDHPHLILLDMLLSGADGRELCLTLKSKPHTKHIPIIIFSAHPTAEKTVKHSGADGFIAKPFDTKELISKIKKLTGK